MPQSNYGSERILAYLYGISGVASLVTTICMSIIWLHWRVVLNTCAGSFQSYYSYYDERDCGCFLWGSDTLSYFVGSDIKWCYWASFGLLIPLFASLVYGWYFIYRVFCKSNRPRQGKMEVRQRSTEILQLTVEQEIVEDDVSPYFWTPALLIALVMVIYGLTHAIIITHGMYKTCQNYRNRIVKYVHATGQFVGVIHSRISCATVFDFMDYLHEDLSYERRRDYRINTGIPAWLAVIGSWVTVVCWIAILVINFKRYTQSKRVRM